MYVDNTNCGPIGIYFNDKEVSKKLQKVQNVHRYNF